ncbi:MAG: 1-phosphofructokinase family hexose kinase [Anaerolineales bacterium]|jgi:1-phosphofructokinase
MIFTVTLNPSLDRTLSIPELHPGEIHRARLVREDLGGKGVNVSRSLRGLGIPSRIMGFAGGRSGEALRVRLLAEGFDVEFVDTGAEIRHNITLFDETSSLYTKINELGPEIEAQHVAAIEDLIGESAQPGDLWAFCGSLPLGAPLDLYARLIERVQEKKGLAFLDASGTALRSGVTARPFAIKVNTEEASELLGLDLGEDLEVSCAASELLEGTTRLVMLTRGARGLILATESERVVAVPPQVEVRSPVGAGDATLAGLLWAVSEQCDPAMMARRAVACGTAAAMQEGSGVGEVSLVRRLLDKVETHPA